MGQDDSLQIPQFPAESPGYEADFHAWLMEQGRRLRRLRVPGIDTDNLAEEIECLGRSEQREVDSRLAVLLTHLLTWERQPEHRSRSWAATIREQRQRLAVVLDESPSLRPTVPARITAVFNDAAAQAADETGIDRASFPERCAWMAEQVMASDFLPGDR